MRLKLPFLGQRNYLHGTTLFDAMTVNLSTASSVSFKFARMVYSDQVDLVDFNAAPARTEEFLVALTWQYGGEQGWRGVRELPISTVVERRPYPEGEVTEAATFTPQQATFRGASNFSFVATLVPLHKALLLRNQIGQGKGQWVFTRLDLSAIPVTYRELSLQIEHVLGRRMVKSRVLVDGSPRGAIFFSWMSSSE